jgi:hypothetical protein
MNTAENNALPAGQPEAVPEGRQAQPSELVGLVTLRGLARELNLPYKWLRRLVRQGQLPVLKSGTRYLFDPITVARKIRGMAGSNNQFGVSPEQYQSRVRQAEEKAGKPSKETLLLERLLDNARKKIEKQKRERGDCE